VRDPSPATRPPTAPLVGRWTTLEPLVVAAHGRDLFEASTPPDADRRFTYLSTEPPIDRDASDRWIEAATNDPDRVYHAVIDRSTGRAEGRQAFLRIDQVNRSIEIGDIYWGPSMARTRLATEALFLAARHVFDDLGYRRFEWKCDSLNEPSRRAATRFGFTFEGLFRRAIITKGRSRDTAWYSMIDDEWPEIRAAYESWLDPANFDDDGRQRRRLAAARQA
jgi:RimJ/RimL family protein N-acetyltransferase